MAAWRRRLPADRRAIGAAVEAAAARFLQANGLVLVDANLRYRDGEIDLLMRDGEVLVFVEVRYRSREDFGGAAASVTLGKQKRVIRAATRYLVAHPAAAALPCRFDVISADGDPEAPRIEWLRAAFDAG